MGGLPRPQGLTPPLQPATRAVDIAVNVRLKDGTLISGKAALPPCRLERIISPMSPSGILLTSPE